LERWWDGDFRERVVAVFGDKTEALGHMRACGGFDRKSGAGMLVEEWECGPAGESEVIFPLGIRER